MEINTQIFQCNPAITIISCHLRASMRLDAARRRDCWYPREEEKGDKTKHPMVFVMEERITRERLISYGDDDRAIIQEVIDYAETRRSRLTRANPKRRIRAKS